MESKSDFIVSEDNDLLRLERHGKTRIVTSAEMLKILQSSAAETESTSK